MFLITKVGTHCGYKVMKLKCPICDTEFLCTTNDMTIVRHKLPMVECPMCTSKIKDVKVEEHPASVNEVNAYLQAIQGSDARALFPKDGYSGKTYVMDTLSALDDYSTEEILKMPIEHLEACVRLNKDGNVFSLHPSAQKTSIFHPGNPKKARYIKGCLERGNLPKVQVVIKKLDDLPRILRKLGFKDSE